MTMEHHNTVRYVLDAVAFSSVIASFTGVLPPIAAGLSIIWLTIQIGEWTYHKMKDHK
jgi:hypothetical protein